MSRARSVLVAGHLCIDITPELAEAPGREPGRLYEVGPARLTLGGCVANTALALTGAGVSTRVCATVGADPLGEIARRLLAEQGIGTEDVVTTAAAATSYSIVVQLPGQDRTFWHHAGANALFTGGKVDLTGVDILHLGYPPLLPALVREDAEPLLGLLRAARAQGITTSVDMVVVDPRSAAARLDWSRILRRILPHVDVATPSVDDLTSALGIRRAPTDDLVEECARRLLDDGCAVAAVSAGARGAFVLTADRERLASAGAALAALAPSWASAAEWVPAAAPARLLSTNGAGDAATAGLLYGLAHGVGVGAAARLAARFAAASIAGERPIAESAAGWAAELTGARP
ncbi:MAG: carbohydrate kinase family protein [Actinomycetes bacterium]